MNRASWSPRRCDGAAASGPRLWEQTKQAVARKCQEGSPPGGSRLVPDAEGNGKAGRKDEEES